MWHLQTKVGTFWIVDAEEHEGEYLLGMDNDVLGRYDDPQKAVNDVRQHETGCLMWDMGSVSRPAPELEEWHTGLPDAWEKADTL
ncbi:MAG: hypothetical protein CMF48_03465 [Legionellales bacterium]|nr:hypothetical protein [Legionellales bacterium]|tara:strand:+ start:171 stop:425 length:255 start_codon:yes stop_codon:yes gene_type:complete